MKLFGTRTSTNLAQPKHRSTMGLLFNPNLGVSIRPMGQALSGFVRLIAMIFVMNGLFPKDHPALKGDAPLSLSFVLLTAWNNLSFTKEGTPKVMLFFAVSAGIVLILLSLITAVMLGFVSSAHAADTGVFTAPDATKDLAINWIDFLFNPDKASEAISNIHAATGLTMPSSTIQTALASALGVYSNAILIIAAFILLYHLTAMVAETAHHGVAMGKRASQLWAPIRLVVAIGLLVPVGSVGLNCGQYIVIQVAKWGSGLASNVWKTFAATLAKEGSMPPIAAALDAKAMIYDLTIMYACEYAYNYQIAAPASVIPNIGDYDKVNNWTWKLDGIPADSPFTQKTSSGVKYSFRNQLVADYDVCGSYTIPVRPSFASGSAASTKFVNSVASTIYDDVYQQFQTTKDKAAQFATHIQSPAYMTIDSSIADGKEPVLDPGSAEELRALVDDYETGLSASIGKASQGSNFTGLVNDLVTNSSAQGWVAAGGWFNTLSAIQSQLNDAYRQSIPSTAPPKIGVGGVRSYESDLNGVNEAQKQGVLRNYRVTKIAVGNFSKVLLEGGSKPTSSSSSYSTKSGNEDPATTVSEAGTNPVGWILKLVGYVARSNGLWQQGVSSGLTNAGIGVQFSGTSNPLLEMAAWGHKNIAAALSLFNWGVGLSAGAGLLNSVASAIPFGWVKGLAGGLAGIGAAGASFLFFMGVLFITMGITVAYFVPFLPFMHFFFNTITWISSVAEAIVGMPLVALAHLNPEGEGIQGHAKDAYSMIFSIMLRPVLMVFGLICGMLIMYVGVGLLNALYAAAVAGSTATMTTATGNPAVINNIFCSVIYVIILYSIANHAFALIGHLPNTAMQWMGGKGMSGQKMGDPGHIAQGVSVTTGYVGTRIADQLQSASKSMSTIGEQIGSGIKSKRDKGKSDALETKNQNRVEERHAEMLGAMKHSGSAGGEGGGSGGPSLSADKGGTSGGESLGSTSGEKSKTEEPLIIPASKYGDPHKEAAGKPYGGSKPSGS